MRFRETSAVSLILLLVLSLLLAGLLAGCGGGGDQSKNQSGGGQQKKQEGQAAKKEPLPRKIAIGTVRAFKDDKRRLSLRPASDAQGKKPLGFKVRKNAQIAVDGEKADFADIKAGQQAQITYVVKQGVNRAVVVHLFNKQTSKGGEKTKQPSKDDGKTNQSTEGGQKTG
jgi:hypothetical protein